jgi:hypothetical protein
MLRRIIAYVVAAAVMVVLGSATHSYFVQEAWSMAAGHADGTARAAIPLADRVSWAVHDLGGLIRPYGMVTSIALFIAFLTAGAVARFTWRRLLVLLFTALRMLLGTVGIFGARGPTGLAAQMAAGLIAGVLFAHLTPPSKS